MAPKELVIIDFGNALSLFVTKAVLKPMLTYRQLDLNEGI